MKLIKITIAIIVATTSGIAISSCQTQAEKDFAAKSRIETLFPDINVDVKEGIATINGMLDSEAAVDSVKTVIKSVKGIDAIVDKCCISMTTNFKTYKPDQNLITQSASILRDYPGVIASIKDGVIDLKGEITIGDWIRLKPKLYTLEARKINNNLAIK